MTTLAQAVTQTPTALASTVAATEYQIQNTATRQTPMFACVLGAAPTANVITRFVLQPGERQNLTPAASQAIYVWTYDDDDGLCAYEAT